MAQPPEADEAPPPRWARRTLDSLHRVESWVAIAAFVGITGALFLDLLGRELLGRGIFTAQRFAVYCMVVVAFLGFALAVSWRAHLGIDVAARLTPARWDRTMERVSDVVAAGGCLFMAYWSWRFVSGSFADQARGQGLEILLWPIQSVLVWCFVSSALRFSSFACWPALRRHAQRD